MPAWIPNWGWCKPKHKRIIDAELRARQHLQNLVDALTAERDNLKRELGHALDRIEVAEADVESYRELLQNIHEVTGEALNPCDDAA